MSANMISSKAKKRPGGKGRSDFAIGDLSHEVPEIDDTMKKIDTALKESETIKVKKKYPWPCRNDCEGGCSDPDHSGCICYGFHDTPP
jgi:hypothetical protein